MQSKSNASYQGLVKKARNSRFVNIGLCAVGAGAVLAGAAVSFSTQYWLPAVLCAAVLIVALAGVLVKSLCEIKAAAHIAEQAVYAAQLSPEQQQRVKKHQMRRGLLFYLSVLLIVVAPEAAVLTAMYLYFSNPVYVLFMAIVAVFCLLCAGTALLYLSARLSAKDPILSVSKCGVIMGRDILPFSAKKREALQLLKFDDYYLLRFVKSAVFGMKYESSIIFPVDGVLRKGLEGTPDEELVLALGLDGVFITEDAFYESRNYVMDDAEPDDISTKKENQSDVREEKPEQDGAQKKTQKKDSSPKEETQKKGKAAKRKPEKSQPKRKKHIYSANAQEEQPTVAIPPAQEQAEQKGFLE